MYALFSQRSILLLLLFVGVGFTARAGCGCLILLLLLGFIILLILFLCLVADLSYCIIAVNLLIIAVPIETIPKVEHQVYEILIVSCGH